MAVVTMVILRIIVPLILAVENQVEVVNMQEEHKKRGMLLGKEQMH